MKETRIQFWRRWLAMERAEGFRFASGGPVYCSRCGHGNAPGSRFCTSCGAILSP